MPNALSSHLSVPSNLHISFWRSALASYTDVAVVDFLEFEWPINYTASTRPHPVSHNHPSTIKHVSIVKHILFLEK